MATDDDQPPDELAAFDEALCGAFYGEMQRRRAATGDAATPVPARALAAAMIGRAGWVAQGHAGDAVALQLARIAAAVAHAARRGDDDAGARQLLGWLDNRANAYLAERAPGAVTPLRGPGKPPVAAEVLLDAARDGLAEARGGEPAEFAAGWVLMMARRMFPGLPPPDGGAAASAALGAELRARLAAPPRDDDAEWLARRALVLCGMSTSAAASALDVFRKRESK